MTKNNMFLNKINLGGDMQKALNGIILFISVSFLSMYIISCASLAESSTSKDEKVSEKDQSEQDILELLGIEDKDAEKAESGKPGSGLEEKISEFKRELIDKNSEINELKSELILKDERIEELSGTLNDLKRNSSPSGKNINSNEFSRRYQVALSHYYTKKYRDGIGLFNELLAIDMNNSLSDNCQYWTGECYYALRDFKKAIIEFEKVFTFSKSNKDDDAQLKLGLCYINLRDNERARSELNRLLTNYPNSEYIEKAKSLLNSL